MIDIFQLKEIHYDGLRGSSDFLKLKYPQNKNPMVPLMVNYSNNLDCPIRYEPDLLKFRKLLKTNCFRLAYTNDQAYYVGNAAHLRKKQFF